MASNQFHRIIRENGKCYAVFFLLYKKYHWKIKNRGAREWKNKCEKTSDTPKESVIIRIYKISSSLMCVCSQVNHDKPQTHLLKYNWIKHQDCKTQAKTERIDNYYKSIQQKCEFLINYIFFLLFSVFLVFYPQMLYYSSFDSQLISCCI